MVTGIVYKMGGGGGGWLQKIAKIKEFYQSNDGTELRNPPETALSQK